MLPCILFCIAKLQVNRLWWICLLIFLNSPTLHSGPLQCLKVTRPTAPLVKTNIPVTSSRKDTPFSSRRMTRLGPSEGRAQSPPSSRKLSPVLSEHNHASRTTRRESTQTQHSAPLLLGTFHQLAVVRIPKTSWLSRQGQSPQWDPLKTCRRLTTSSLIPSLSARQYRCPNHDLPGPTSTSPPSLETSLRSTRSCLHRHPQQASRFQNPVTSKRPQHKRPTVLSAKP